MKNVKNVLMEQVEELNGRVEVVKSTFMDADNQRKAYISLEIMLRTVMQTAIMFEKVEVVEEIKRSLKNVQEKLAEINAK